MIFMALHNSKLHTRLQTSSFTRFASTGNPNVAEFNGADWHQVTTAQPLTGINIREDRCEIVKLPEAARLKVWDSFYEREAKVLA